MAYWEKRWQRQENLLMRLTKLSIWRDLNNMLIIHTWPEIC